MSERQIHEDKANYLYNGILNKIVIPMVGNQSTYQNKLKEAGEELLGTPDFHGVFPSDKIPRLTTLNPYAIINLDNSNEPGSHWVAIAHADRKMYVYDSFGRKSTEILPDIFASGNGSNIIDTDYDAEQSPKEMNCGARCLAFLILFKYYGSNMALLI